MKGEMGMGKLLWHGGGLENTVRWSARGGLKQQEKPWNPADFRYRGTIAIIAEGSLGDHCSL